MRSVGECLRAHGFTFEKRYGQNFLTDENLLEAIASDSGTDGIPCVEIGCGAGTLTRRLADHASRVIGYEIDERLRPVLSETLGGVPNVEIRFGDFQGVDLAALESELGEGYTVCANLPYYITTPLILKCLEESERLRSLTVMVQKEVADRLVALPGTPDYGAITVAVRLIGRANIVRSVRRTLFVPPPNVDSAVVRIDLDPEKRKVFSSPVVRKLARAAFAMRRKTLVNNLISAFPLSREQAERALLACGLPKEVRGERLSAEDFVRLAVAIETEQNGVRANPDSV